MFHGKHFDHQLQRAADGAAIDIGTAQRELLGRFGDWLIDEGVEAGGIGPAESQRVVDRHLADSIVYAAAWTRPPATLLDVGSGVGIPGIPLAITHPTTEVTLLDRSGTRCRLARRAVRILGLDNVTVVQGDARSVDGQWDAIVFRASLPPDAALDVGRPLMTPDGCVVVGLSRVEGPGVLPPVPTIRISKSSRSGRRSLTPPHGFLG